MDERGGNVLQGKRVVVTRAAEQSEALVRALKEKGALPVVLPMVAFGAPEDLTALDAAIRNASTFDWIFLTSQNAVRAVLERCASLKLELREAFSGVKVAAVGPATADAATKVGFDVSHVAAKRQGIGLAEELGQRVRGKRVFLPRSDRANPALVNALKGLRAEVTEVCAYKTLKPGAAEVSNTPGMEDADAVLFFSPSAVHHFEESLGSAGFLELSQRSVFAAIGPVTEEALRKAKVERVLLAGDTSVGAIVDTLTDHFAEQRAGLSAGVKRS